MIDYVHIDSKGKHTMIEIDGHYEFIAFIPGSGGRYCIIVEKKEVKEDE